MSRAKALADANLMSTYRRLPVTFTHGEGMHLFDDQGKRYLDFVAGIAVTALGHAHPRVAAAIAGQAHQLVHTSNLYYTEPMAELAAKLTELLGWPDGRVFFANSGAEANECAIKLIRKWSRSKYSEDRYETIAAFGSFHGRTLETLAATGQPEKWKPFSPLPPGFSHVPYDDPDALAEAVTDQTAAVLLEPVLGEGGVVVPGDGYLNLVSEVCDARDLAFIADEVQTGLGRTGFWFGFQSDGAVPDVITLAKSLGNGLPIGVCVARGELADAFEPGDHATTIGGGPVVCAAALTVLEVIQAEDLVTKAAATGKFLQGRLMDLVRKDLLSEVRGRGLLIAAELAGSQSEEVVTRCLEEGLLVNNVSPTAIRLCPALIAGEAECSEAIEILESVLTAVREEA